MTNVCPAVRKSTIAAATLLSRDLCRRPARSRHRGRHRLSLLPLQNIRSNRRASTASAAAKTYLYLRGNARRAAALVGLTGIERAVSGQSTVMLDRCASESRFGAPAGGRR
jgi:hypothetical protein